jgi:translocator protein
MRKPHYLLFAILICLLAGFIGSIFTMSSIMSWYSRLEKPYFNPPNYVFGPVWTVLYILMGIALYLVWAKKDADKQAANIAFFTQLTLNVIWSILFFGMQSPLFAFLEIILLWTAIVATIVEFYRISKAAAVLMMPYLLWVSFAAVLNLSIYLLNR